MNIDFVFCETQIKRLAQKKGFPFSQPEAEAELARVAAIYGASTVHVRDTITAISEDWERCPEPADLRRLLRESAPRPIESCTACKGTGWIHHIQKTDAEQLSSARCSCPIGRTFAEADAKRRQELTNRGIPTW